MKTNKARKFRNRKRLILHDKRHDWDVRVVEASVDEDGNWWYYVEPTEFLAIAR